MSAAPADRSCHETTSDYVFNPFAPGFADDPYPHYEQLRAAAPVHEHPLGFWMLVHYEDVTALLRSDNSVEESNTGPSPIREMYEAAAGGGGRRSDGLSMLDQDPPDHTRLRRLVSQAFTPRSIAALEPRVTELVDEALQRIAAQGSVDLIEALAYPLPFTVISEMLGMPSTDHARLRELAGMLVRSLEPVTDPELIAAIAEADSELTARIAEVIAAKRREPGDDLMTALISAEDEGDVLGDDELVAQVVVLYVAGHETTVKPHRERRPRAAAQLGAVRAAAFTPRPGQQRRRGAAALRQPRPAEQADHPGALPGARARDPGGRIRAGEPGLGQTGTTASGDPTPGRCGWTGPTPVSTSRSAAAPITVYGAALARLEGQIAIGRLVRRFPDLALDGAVRWNGRLNLRGPVALPVTVR